MKRLLLSLLSVLAVSQISKSADPEKQIFIEACIFQVDDQCFKQLNDTYQLSAKNVRMFSKEELTKFQKFIDEKQVSRLSAPKITVFDGQEAKFCIGSEKTFVKTVQIEADKNGSAVLVPQNEQLGTSLSLTVLPTISKDNKNVKLSYKFANNTLVKMEQIQVTTYINSAEPKFSKILDSTSALKDFPITQFIEQPVVKTLSSESTVEIPLSNSFLVDMGKQDCDISCEVKTPILCEIPYLNRLFRSQGIKKSTCHTCLLMTVNMFDDQKLQDELRHMRMGHSTQVYPNPVAKGVRQLPLHSVVPMPTPSMSPPLLSPPSMPTPTMPTPALAVKLLPLQSVDPLAYSTPLPATQSIPLQVVQATPELNTPARVQFVQPLSPAKLPATKVIYLPSNSPMQTLPVSATAVVPATKHDEIIKILKEQYQIACQTGDKERARIIATHCLELDPTCFTTR